MKGLVLTIIPTFLFLKNLSSQNLAFFDYPLNFEKVTLCQALEKYGIIDNTDFQFIKLSERLHSLIVTYNDKIFISNTYVLMRDTMDPTLYQLNQIELSSYEYLVNEENFIKLLNEANRNINQFIIKYGQPTKYINNKDKYFGQANSEVANHIIACTWDNDDVKIKITLSKEGEHSDYYYQLSIHKFQDYFGNVKLPEWWDGY